MNDTRHPLVRDNILHNALLHNITDILLVDVGRIRVGGSCWED